MNYKDTILENLFSYNISQLWNIFLQIHEEEPEKYKDTYQAIKEGYTIKIPIYWFIHEWYEEHPENHTTKFKGFKKNLITELEQEKDKRMMIMRKIILKKYGESDNPLEAR